MYDFERIKRQILDRVELLGVVSEHVNLRRSGRRWVGLCPFHSEKTPSFTVLPEQGLFKCFGCGKGGDLFTFVQLREGLPFMEVLQLLADRAGVEFAPSHNAGAAKSVGADRPTLAKANLWAAEFFRAKLLDREVGEHARAYVRGRGFSDETVNAFGIGLATEAGPSLVGAAKRAGFSEAVLFEADLLRRDETGRSYETFRNRLMFPIRDATGRIIGFGGRTLTDDKAKYLNTRQNALFDKGRNLYGIDRARPSIAERGRAVLVEGYTDCIACHQGGVSEAVATLGTALTPEQVGLLRRYGEEVILLFDSDTAGEAAADRALRLALPACLRVKMARIEGAKDPCDYLQVMGAASFTDVLNRAVDALEFRWLQTRQRFGADASDSKRREAVLDFLQVVSEASGSQAVDAIQRGLLVNQVAHLLRMDRDEVARLLERGRRPTMRTAVSGGACKSPLDAEQCAWINVLEVGLNDPGLLEPFGDADCDRIADERDRRIAKALFAAVAASPDTRLADVLARLTEEEDAARVEQLARKGAERGNFEATYRLARQRIELAVRCKEDESQRGALLDAVRAGDGGAIGPPASNLSLGIKQHKHFAPRRLIRRSTVPR